VTSCALLSCFSRAFAMSSSYFAMSVCGATQITLPFWRLASPLARRITSSAWSQGTLTSRRVTLPCTLSAATMLRLDTSASSCSTERTGMSWKLKVTRLPLYTMGLGAPSAECSLEVGRENSTTYWLPVW